jgi:hypothetical protein
MKSFEFERQILSMPFCSNEQQGCVKRTLLPLGWQESRLRDPFPQTPLTLSMVRALSGTLHIPADLLIRAGGVLWKRTERTDPDTTFGQVGWFSNEELRDISGYRSSLPCSPTQSTVSKAHDHLRRNTGLTKQICGCGSVESASSQRKAAGPELGAGYHQRSVSELSLN